MLTEYLWEIPVRSILYGPNGTIDWVAYSGIAHNPLALFRYSPSAAYAAGLFGLSAAVAAVYLLGIFPSATCWVFAITTYATSNRNFPDFDGGRNLLVLLAFLLCFVDSSRYFALLTRPVRSRGMAMSIRTMAHNSARWLIAWQVCNVYAWAVFWKLGGQQWRSGTALYYAFSIGEFQAHPWLSHLLCASAAGIAAATFLTLIVQGAFPFLMWTRTKRYLVGIAVVMHVGIAIVMGLISFSATMIAADVSVLADADLKAFAARVRSVVKNSGSIARRGSIARGEAMSQKPS